MMKSYIFNIQNQIKANTLFKGFVYLNIQSPAINIHSNSSFRKGKYIIFCTWHTIRGI